MDIWKRYLHLYEGQYRNLALSVFLSVLQSVTVIPVSLIIKSIFDHALPENDFKELFSLCIFILILYIFSGFLTLLTRNVTLRATKRIIRILRNKIIEKIYQFPRAYFSGIDRMKLHAGIVQDTFRLDVMSNGLVTQLFPSVLIITGLLFVLLYLDTFLFLIVIFITPFFVIFAKYIGKILKNKVSIYHRLFEDFSKRVMILLNIIDLTWVTVSEQEEIRKQGELHALLEKKSFDQAWYSAYYRIFNETATSAFGIVIMIAGGFRMMKGMMTIGELFAFFAALALLKRYVITISGVLPWVIEGNESLKSLFSFLKEKSELPYSGTNVIDFKGRIRFENLSFSYNREKLLEDISFELSPGKISCIKGPNGSGKSTIVNLLLGFFRPDAGKISADGVPYDEIDIKCLRRSTGVVFQDTMILPGSIMDNITYGLKEIDPEKLKEILDLSMCNEFLRKLPEGADTLIENKRDKLSGGEIQRISIARAMLRGTSLIIMDEPNANLDRNMLKSILGNLRRSSLNISFLIISHDDDVALMADEVFEILNGTLIRRSGFK